MSVVPIIDIAPFLDPTSPPEARRAVADAVAAACETIGFLVITGHGVPQATIDRMYAETRAFFAQPMADKLVAVSPVGDEYQGFAPGSDPYATTPEGTAAPSVREVFHSYPFDTPAEAIAAGYDPRVVASMPANLWPVSPAGFEPVWKAYFGEMEALAGRMLHLFAAALHLPEDWFDDKVDRHLGSMAANCYLEQPVENPGLRIRAHVDFSTLTILYQDDAVGGLQVHQRGAGWLDVPYLEGSYVVNLGDLMARWTNERWVATPHRVVNPPREHAMTRRISMPFFHLPNHEAIIEPIPTCVDEAHPARFEPVLAGEWTEMRRKGRSANFGRIPVPA